jgi:hypothetical protein
VLAHLPLTENTSVEIALGTLRRESVRHGHCTRQVTETAQGYLGNGIVVLQTDMVVCRSENRIPTRSVGPARGLMVCTQTDAVPWSRDLPCRWHRGCQKSRHPWDAGPVESAADRQIEYRSGLYVKKLQELS